MAYSVEPYDEEATIFEVVNNGTPEFYGSEEECIEWMQNKI